MPCGAGRSSAPASAEVLEMAEPSKTEQRKAEHVNIILQENVSAEYNYWNDVRLVHTALPEIDLDDVDVSVKFFGKRLEAPLIISSMTGGCGGGEEVVQPEGDRRAKGCLAAIKALASKFPLMAKETGAGISRETAQKLKAAGARAIDVGGLGGTSFSAVEHYRARKEAASLKERLGATFWNWGIPTPASLLLADVGLPLVATGGVRSGLDVAKGIALGATMAGMAKPMLEAARVSADAAIQELRAVVEELKAAMFLTGSTSIAALQDRPVVVSPPTASWLEAGEA